MAADLKRVSISKSGLVLSGCTAWANPGSAWYDESRRPPEDTQKRDDGIAFHEVMDRRLSSNGDEVDAVFLPRLVPQWVSHANVWLSEHLLPRCQKIETEVAIAVNWSTGEVRTLNGVHGRNYPSLGDGWQFGTADIVALLNDGSLLIADWKTGGTDGAEEQLLSLAAAFQETVPLDLWESKNSTTRRPVRIACLRVDADGVWPNEREVTKSELRNHWDAMTFAMEDIGEKYDPKPGTHCTVLYCPHLAYCTAISSVVRDCGSGPESNGTPLVPAEALMSKLTSKPTNDAEAGEQVALVSAAKRQINYIIDGAKEYVNAGGRVISGQFEWKDRGNGFRWGKK